MISLNSMFLVFVNSLFSTKATPADDPGCSLSLELITLSLREYRVFIWFSHSSVRCVSCRHRIPIFFSLITWCMTDHFDIALWSSCRDVLPFIFRDAILRLALVFFRFFG